VSHKINILCCQIRQNSYSWYGCHRSGGRDRVLTWGQTTRCDLEMSITYYLLYLQKVVSIDVLRPSLAACWTLVNFLMILLMCNLSGKTNSLVGWLVCLRVATNFEAWQFLRIGYISDIELSYPKPVSTQNCSEYGACFLRYYRANAYNNNYSRIIFEMNLEKNIYSVHCGNRLICRSLLLFLCATLCAVKRTLCKLRYTTCIIQIVQ